MRGLALVLSICMGLSFGKVAKVWANIVSGIFFCVLLMLVHNVYLVNVQKTYCHTKQLMQWLDLMLKGLAR
jgi:hypothetical protein